MDRILAQPQVKLSLLCSNFNIKPMCITGQMLEYYWSEESFLRIISQQSNTNYKIRIMGTERRAQIRPTCPIFEQ
jgi:hypothetical protein